MITHVFKVIQQDSKIGGFAVPFQPWSANRRGSHFRDEVFTDICRHVKAPNEGTLGCAFPEIWIVDPLLSESW